MRVCFGYTTIITGYIQLHLYVICDWQNVVLNSVFRSHVCVCTHARTEIDRHTDRHI